MSAEVNCQNCAGSCCRGEPFIGMDLTPDEAQFMIEGSSRLVVVEEAVDYDRPDARYPNGVFSLDLERQTVRWLFVKGMDTQPLPAGVGRYALMGQCGYLKTDEDGWQICSVYDKRPKVCQDFVVGSFKCLLFRARDGIGELPE